MTDNLQRIILNAKLCITAQKYEVFKHAVARLATETQALDLAFKFAEQSFLNDSDIVDKSLPSNVINEIRELRADALRDVIIDIKTFYTFCEKM